MLVIFGLGFCCSRFLVGFSVKFWYFVCLADLGNLVFKEAGINADQVNGENQLHERQEAS